MPSLTDQRGPALPTPLISLSSFVDGLACLFLQSDPRLTLKKKYLGEGSHLDPPNIYTMVTPLYMSNKNRACIRLTDGAEECAGVLLQFSNEVAHLSFHRFIQCLGVDCGLISEKQRLSQQSSVPDTHTHTQF